MSTLRIIEKKEQKTVDRESQVTEIHDPREEREQQFMKTYEALRKYASLHFSCDDER
ncbi:MAG: hypothetical protein NPIRA01_09010 [Nitrospirales bacterium]|nr:MAG: hypothetical protein NPIRA01_09010 [Nitrospirales bacterium]